MIETKEEFLKRKAGLRLQADTDFNNVVKPVLISHGWSHTQISSMLYRVLWGKNYDAWTVRLTDVDPSDVPDIESHIRNLWRTGEQSLKLVIHACLRRRTVGPLVSYGVIRANDLAKIMFGGFGCYDKAHPIDGSIFRCLPFGVAKAILRDNCTIRT